MYCNYANTLLRTFISHSAAIYGQKFVVYNIHSLSHLANECEAHGKLDGFSAFQFENKLQSIKASLKSGYKPLKQVAFRDLEKGQIDVILENGENVVVLSWKRKKHVNEVVDGTQFRRICVNDVIFKCNEKKMPVLKLIIILLQFFKILCMYKIKYTLLVFPFLLLRMHMNILCLLLILEFSKLHIRMRKDKFFF